MIYIYLLDGRKASMVAECDGREQAMEKEKLLRQQRGQLIELVFVTCDDRDEAEESIMLMLETS